MTARPVAAAIYADSQNCADMLYTTGFFAPDPFLWLRLRQDEVIVVSTLEYGRAVNERHAHVRVLSQEEAKRQCRLRRYNTAAVMAAFLRRAGLKQCRVPAAFPAGLAHELRRDHSVRVVPADDAFCPGRRRKTTAQIEMVKRGVELAEAGLEAGLALLRQADVGRDAKLVLNRQTLTAARVRGEIEAEIVRRGGVAFRTIVAPGAHGADPHAIGEGPIAANTPVIIDIFPRDIDTGYHGDLTRTVVKGRAPEVVAGAFRAVQKARDRAIAKAKPGVGAATLHRLAADTLSAAGFETDAAAERPCGFFHGLGHGLGLEVHERPRVNTRGPRLRQGDVVTIEPGLYYPDWGGVRLEDVIALRPGGCRNLTSAPTQLEL